MKKITLALLVAGTMLTAACGDVVTSPSVVHKAEDGSVVSILDSQNHAIKPQGSVVAILDGIKRD